MTSDDGSEDVLHEWDALVKNFNAHKYTVTDCTDKEFIGINITHDADFNYYMDQIRISTTTVPETPAHVLQVQQDGSAHVSHTRWTNGH